MILDSPFSALDNKIVHNILGKVFILTWQAVTDTNAMQCLEKAISNILLRKRRTVIVTTSDPSLLSLAQVGKLKLNFKYFFQFPFSQHIIVLDNGTIKAQGTFQDVKEEFPDNLTR